MGKFLCIHGHFYQPPRENPWLEAVELQDSAAPYHDWNERVASECYGPNARARVLNDKGTINSLVNNYASISFNFGPTLMKWMETQFAEIHQAVIQADELSQTNFSGHGSAIAQVYNHMILPLAAARDKQTQVLWGIRDFEYRFRRYPEGMWLPETAADTESLEALAQFGIKFTILSPYQASQVRLMGTEEWADVDGGLIDPRRSYLCRLPSGRSIAIFFYDGPMSTAVAFEKLLDGGDKLASRLLCGFSPKSEQDELVHIATDGESYGHHHRFGDMALAWALHHITQAPEVRLTNYGEYLATHAPEYEVRIHEKTAWSCVHGVGRWFRDCGCNSGGHPGWNQGWRTPLRNAFDWLRDVTSPLFESQASRFLKNPWEARDDYVSVVLNRAPHILEPFLAKHAHTRLNQDQRADVIKLLEMERNAMLMYTSCGWFFDELSGIETVQTIQYAARVVQLTAETVGLDLETQFLERLGEARSNIPEHSDGATIYKKWIKPSVVDWRQATAHHAIGGLFKGAANNKKKVFVFTFEDAERDMSTAGKTRLLVGRTTASSEITGESAAMEYAAIYMGEQNLTAGVRPSNSLEAYRATKDQLKGAFNEVDFPEVIRLIDHNFGGRSYSLKSLFKDEEREVLQELLTATRADLESRFRRVANLYVPLMKFLGSSAKSLLPAVETAANFVLATDLRQQFITERADIPQLRDLLEEARSKSERFFDEDLSYLIKRRMEKLMEAISKDAQNIDRIRHFRDLTELVNTLPLRLNLWKVQNVYWEMLHWLAPEYRNRAHAGDEEARGWLEAFLKLGEGLSFAVNGDAA